MTQRMSRPCRPFHHLFSISKQTLSRTHATASEAPKRAVKTPFLDQSIYNPQLTREQREARTVFLHYSRAPISTPHSTKLSLKQQRLYSESHQALLKELEPLLDTTKQQQSLQAAIKASNAIVASSPSALSAASIQRAKQPTVTIHATSNNTILTLAGANGEVISWASGGSCGLKKSARGSSESGLRAAQRVAQVAKENNISHVNVVTKGFGQGKEEAFRTLRAEGLKIGTLSDATPIPHGGCRPRKRRRV